VTQAAPQPVNQTVTITLKVQNSSAAAGAAGVVVTDRIPDKVQYASSSTSQGSCVYNSATRVVTCDLGAIARGAAATVTIVANVGKQGGFIDNTAQVTTSTLDINTANNTSTSRIRLR
jgi:uncharacterized repeat protein (TIGR01451 family)